MLNNKLYGLNVKIIQLSAISIIPLLFFGSFAFIFSNNQRNYYLLILCIFLSFLFFIDIIYARAFGHLINLYVILSKGVTDGLSGSIISLIKIFDLLLFVDLPILFFKLLKRNNTVIKRRILFFLFTSILTAVIMVMQFAGINLAKKTFQKRERKRQ